jgi:hypothetical protein
MLPQVAGHAQRPWYRSFSNRPGEWMQRFDGAQPVDFSHEIRERDRHQRPAAVIHVWRQRLAAVAGSSLVRWSTS